MKLIFLLTFFILLSATGYSKTTRISGVISEAGNDTLTVVYLPLKQGETPIMDYIVCQKGHFSNKIEFQSPLIHLVRISSNKWKLDSLNTFPYELFQTDIYFFIRGGESLHINSKLEDNIISTSVEGSKLSKQFTGYQKLLASDHKLYNTLCNAYAIAKEKKDSILIKKSENRLKEISNTIHEKTVHFIEQHPDWEYSAELIPGLPEDLAFAMYEKLDPKIKETYFGQYARDVTSSIKTGDPVKELVLPDLNGKMVSTNSFKGKFMVLEFWGSWCGVCINGLPKMKEYYNRYKDKIQFISIACRETEESWKKAVQKYNIEWINLYNTDENLPNRWAVFGYPTKIIIDNKGVVAGIYLGEDQEFYSQLDVLFRQHQH